MNDQQSASFTLTADIGVLRPGETGEEILLIKRGRPPYAGMYALPGGKVHLDESAEQAALRELEEETGLSGVALWQVATESSPGRDPRGRYVSVIFLCRIPDPSI